MATINFNGLNNLENIGASWLGFCPNLNRVDFTHLTKLKTVDKFALYDGIMKTVLINQDFPQGLRVIIQNRHVTFVIEPVPPRVTVEQSTPAGPGGPIDPTSPAGPSGPSANGGTVRQRPKKARKKARKKSSY